jgi:hypothetical protein
VGERYQHGAHALTPDRVKVLLIYAEEVLEGYVAKAHKTLESAKRLLAERQNALNALKAKSKKRPRRKGKTR